MSKGKGGRQRENVPVPNKKEASDAARLLRKGSSAGGRVMAERAKAKRGRH
jgi:hypothetical protein